MVKIINIPSIGNTIVNLVEFDSTKSTKLKRIETILEDAEYNGLDDDLGMVYLNVPDQGLFYSSLRVGDFGGYEFPITARVGIEDLAYLNEHYPGSFVSWYPQ